MVPGFKLNPEEIFSTLADLVSINSVNPAYQEGLEKERSPNMSVNSSAGIPFPARLSSFLKTAPM